MQIFVEMSNQHYYDEMRKKGEVFYTENMFRIFKYNNGKRTDVHFKDVTASKDS